MKLLIFPSILLIHIIKSVVGVFVPMSMHSKWKIILGNTIWNISSKEILGFQKETSCNVLNYLVELRYVL